MRGFQKAKHCATKNQSTNRREAIPLLVAIFIALIPKCPFCILAYSSAITLCSGSKIYMHHPDWTSWISIGLAALTLLMILMNYRGKRTIVAALLVLIGSSLIMLSELWTGEIKVYYYGAVLL
ncbi:MAG: hypothetical protein AAGD05_16035, partial [Bacteroidota bacterium]